MHAAIDRFVLASGSVDDLAEAAYVLGTRLSRTPGFVAALSILAGNNCLITVRMFQDKLSLEAASAVVERWMADHHTTVGDHPTKLVSGEVVAQKGL